MTRSYFKQSRNAEDGATLVEFSIAASVFFIALFGVLEVSRLLWTHNALTDAARSGSRYAVLHQQNATAVQNVVVYGAASPAAGAQPIVPGLTTAMVTVTYNNFGVNLGTATITISGYTFNFSVPLIGSTVNLPAYKSVMTGESAGVIPTSLRPTQNQPQRLVAGGKRSEAWEQL